MDKFQGMILNLIGSKRIEELAEENKRLKDQINRTRERLNIAETDLVCLKKRISTLWDDVILEEWEEGEYVDDYVKELLARKLADDLIKIGILSIRKEENKQIPGSIRFIGEMQVVYPLKGRFR